MNILRIVYDWPDKNNITTGLAPAPYELSIAQSKLGHKIFVLCGNLNKKNIVSRKFKYELEDGKIVVYNLPRGLKGFGPFLTSSIFVLPFYFYLRLFKKIDIVHNQGHMGVWLLLYKYIFRFLDTIKIVGHFHNTAKGRENAIVKSGDKIDFMSKYFEYPIHKMSDKLSTKVCKALITVSKGNCEELVDLYGADKNKVYVVESGVNTDRYKKEGEKVDIGFSNKDTILGNLGLLSRRKRIHLILQALTILPENYKLCLWGKWDTEYQKELSEIIKKSNLKDRIQYFGEIPYFESDKAYRSIDIFLLPSSYEGLPKVVLEALACGDKVVASGFTTEKSMDNLLLQDISGSNELSKIIVTAKKSKDGYKQTRQVIERYYSWDSKAQEIDLIYNKII